MTALVVMVVDALWVERIGFFATTGTTAAFVPQLVRIVRLRSARDISLPTFLLFSAGVYLWLVYGLHTGSRPVIASNFVTLLISFEHSLSKFKYDRQEYQNTRTTTQDVQP